MNAAALAELLSEQARIERAKKAAETRWEEPKKCLENAPSTKSKEPKPKEERSRQQAAKSSGVSERRHLTESQRGMVAARVANLEEGRPEKTRSIDRVSSEQAAKMLNIGIATVGRARAILTHGIPELIQAVDEGTITVACHTQEEIAEVCGITRDIVRELLGNSENFPKSPKYLFQDDFDPPIYNVRKQQVKTPGPCASTVHSHPQSLTAQPFPSATLRGPKLAFSGGIVQDVSKVMAG